MFAHLGGLRLRLNLGCEAGEVALGDRRALSRVCDRGREVDRFLFEVLPSRELAGKFLPCSAE